MKPSIVLGHLALHYRPGDEQPARRLLQLLGCTLVDNGPAPGSDGFCTVLVDKGTANHADNVMFLSKLPPAQVAVEDAIGGLAGSETDEGDHRGARARARGRAPARPAGARPPAAPRGGAAAAAARTPGGPPRVPRPAAPPAGACSPTCPRARPCPAARSQTVTTYSPFPAR